MPSFRAVGLGIASGRFEKREDAEYRASTFRNGGRVVEDARDPQITHEFICRNQWGRPCWCENKEVK